MKIIFKATGEISGLEKWLQAFGVINDTLLLEIDSKEQKFVAKIFTDEHSIIKYGVLPFADANLAVDKVIGPDGSELTAEQWAAQNPLRVRVGIFKTLPRFVKTVSLFSTDTSGVEIDVEFEELRKDTRLMFEAKKILFSSVALKMQVAGASVEEFEYLDDSKFAAVAEIPNPLEFAVTPAINKALIDISSVWSADVKKDIVDFKPVKDADGSVTLHAVDHKEGKYDYVVNRLASGEYAEDVAVPVIRNNYILATKGDSEDGSVVISANKGVEKIKIVSGANFVTIIAGVRV